MNDTTPAPASDAASCPTRTRASRAPRVSPTSRVALTGLGVVAVAVSLTGCSVVTDVAKEALGAQQVQQRHFDSYDDVPRSSTSEDAAWFLSDWVPTDARDLDIRLDTEQPGYELSFVSATAPDLGACAPVDGDLGGPALDPALLPATLPTTGLVSCGDGRVVAGLDGRWFSWTPTVAVPDDDGSSTLR